MHRPHFLTVSTTLMLASLFTGCVALDEMKAGTFRVENFELSKLAPKNTGGAASQRTTGQPRTPGKKTYVASEFELTEVPHTLLTMPVAEGRLTSRYGYRMNPTAKFLRLPKRHKGIDYAAPAGTPVYASGDGVVDRKYVSSSYGNYIRISHENGFHSAYAHLAAFAEGIEEGSRVSRGQIIGAVGSTGRSTSAHLHYELLKDGRHVDPLLGK